MTNHPFINSSDDITSKVLLICTFVWIIYYKPQLRLIFAGRYYTKIGMYKIILCVCENDLTDKNNSTIRLSITWMF